VTLSMRTGGYLTSQKKKSIWFAHNGGFYRSWPLSAFLAKTRPVCSATDLYVYVYVATDLYGHPAFLASRIRVDLQSPQT